VSTKVKAFTRKQLHRMHEQARKQRRAEEKEQQMRAKEHDRSWERDYAPMLKGCGK
jgi:hypothetical protein